MTSPVARWALVIVTIAGLAIDAYVHFDLAPTYDGVATTTMSKGDLFRLESILAILAGLALLVRPRRWTAGLAALVAGGGAVLLLVFYYVDTGDIGPIPTMFDPTWTPTSKVVTFVAQLVAAVAALALLPALSRARAGDRHPSPTPA